MAFRKLLVACGKTAEADMGSALQKDNVLFTAQHATAGVLGRYAVLDRDGETEVETNMLWLHI